GTDCRFTLLSRSTNSTEFYTLSLHDALPIFLPEVTLLRHGALVIRARRESGGLGVCRGRVDARRVGTQHLLEGFQVVDGHFPALYGDIAFVLEAGKDPADCFHRKSEVVADVVTGHGQAELGAGKLTALEAAGKVEQQRGNPFFRGIFTKQHGQLAAL